MRRALFSSFASGCLVVFSLTAAAQDRGPGQDEDPFHQGRDTYFHQEHWHAGLFEQVKKDVEHVRSTAWPKGGDRFRLDKTIAELDELQGKFASHAYDDKVLEHVINTLGRVASYNQMPPREREIINDDIGRLREYRDHHADWFNEQDH